MQAAGYKLLVYVQCCLRQQRFPPGSGVLPPHRGAQVKAAVLGDRPCALRDAFCVLLPVASSGRGPPQKGSATLGGSCAGLLLFGTVDAMSTLWRGLGGGSGQLPEGALRAQLPGQRSKALIALTSLGPTHFHCEPPCQAGGRLPLLGAHHHHCGLGAA